MNIRDLKYLVTVADLKSFQKAAMSCNVSQPTLSGQIRKLEEYLGNKVFERTTKSFSITPFGEKIIELSRPILDQVDELTAYSRQSKNPWSIPLKVGIIPTLGPYLIPKFYLYLKKIIPEARVVFDENITSVLMKKLKNGELDVLLLATDESSSQFSQVELFEEPFWVAFPIGSKLETLTKILSQDVNKERVLLLNDGHCLRQQTLKLCRDNLKNYAPEDLNTIASSLETLINLVAAGEGCTFVPALALQSAWTTDMGVLVRKIDDPNAKRTVSMLFRKNFSRIKQLEELGKMITYQSPNTVKVLMK